MSGHGINDITLLIDAIVRQTVVLIAQLATVGGNRAPLAHVANQVFLGLTRELQTQGVNQKVSADMFGMALRTYQRKRQRLQASATEHGRSLWEVILRFVQSREVVSRAEIFARFPRDEEAIIRGILSDLVDSGLVFRSGYSHNARYRAATEHDDEFADASFLLERTAMVVWVGVYMRSPVERSELIDLCGISEAHLDQALAILASDGRIEVVPRGQDLVYRCDSYVIPYGSDVGWSAAVFDHYQAMVGAICNKLHTSNTRATHRDAIGGSTFAFDVWEGHPMESEVLGTLARLRAEVHALRGRVEQYNAGAGDAEERSARRVICYVGQNVIQDAGDAEDEGHVLS